ncbi:Hsp20/alpha crystallin family protein [Deinococcus hopiensis]|uniref:HSP20 family protein n=1 Tax=Deinococcus hopiensis KR-140 TaxID=695939 RepID=A0A1W1UXH6_9DEIO|nr:Hsp20/alpha crystallin family protein [Deinococcus hopiensis]SMB85461.1 HSP20 family protein [Deinococcus hopiensis KR-140]
MTVVPDRSHSLTPWSPDVMPTISSPWPALNLSNAGPDPSLPGHSRLLLNMYETSTHVMVDLALPGVKPEELDVQVEDLTILIRGRYSGPEDASTRYWYKALPDGEFFYRLTLPVKVAGDAIEAKLESGLLHLHLPKVPEARRRKIEIKRAGSSTPAA